MTSIMKELNTTGFKSQNVYVLKNASEPLKIPIYIQKQPSRGVLRYGSLFSEHLFIRTPLGTASLHFYLLYKL